MNKQQQSQLVVLSNIDIKTGQPHSKYYVSEQQASNTKRENRKKHSQKAQHYQIQQQ